METTGDSKASYLSYSRWSLKRGADLGDVLKLFAEVVQPAYSELRGFLSLSLQEIADSRQYLVIAAWDTRDDYDNWVRLADDWRKAHEDAFNKWQFIMDFEDEFQASIISRADVA